MSETPTLFELCLAIVFMLEGGKVNRSAADDPGGATNLGISLRFLKGLGARGDLDGDGDVDAKDIDLVTHTIAAGFYKSEFWRDAHCDKFPPLLALCVFDAAVHHGPTRAIKLLQGALRVPTDGKVGPQTIAAAARMDQAYAMSRMLYLRETFSRTLHNWTANAEGWSRRFFLLAYNAGILNSVDKFTSET